MIPLSTPSMVRETRGLLTESAGGATDSQINAAIELAQRKVLSIVTKAQYETALESSEDSSYEEQEKKRDFTNAEKRYAISYLPNILTNTQLQSTGYKLESTIGEATTRFGNSEDISVVSEFWNRQALKYLSVYMKHTLVDSCGKQFGWESDEGDFSIYAI